MDCAAVLSHRGVERQEVETSGYGDATQMDHVVSHLYPGVPLAHLDTVHAFEVLVTFELLNGLVDCDCARFVHESAVVGP